MKVSFKNIALGFASAFALAACADMDAGHYDNYHGTMTERGMRRCTYWDDCNTKRTPKPVPVAKETPAETKPAEKAPEPKQVASAPVEHAAKPAEAAAAPAPVVAAAAVAETAPGSVNGKVKDQDGKPVEANIEFSQDGKGAGSANTASGAYSSELSEGDYLVTAKADGFEPASRTVKVAAGKKTTADFTLVSSKKALARVEGNRIIILQTVYFATSKSDILQKSNDLLNDVARVLVDNPQIKKVEVSGHTDSVGDAKKNKALSQSRAESVKTYLVKKGVAAGRLTPVGYGEEKPEVTPDDTKDKQAQNRRVEFVVLDPVQQ